MFWAGNAYYIKQGFDKHKINYAGSCHLLV
jgi:hypothetical protein